MIEEKVGQAAKARHDARHHDLVIMEYARRGAMEELLRYMEEKAEMEEISGSSGKTGCWNKGYRLYGDFGKCAGKCRAWRSV